jgi:hypothetical protein
MPIKEFADECYTKLSAGGDSVEVGIGFPQSQEEWIQCRDNRGKCFDALTKIMLANYEL